MAKKKNAPATAKAESTGVEKVIAFLVANKANIRGLVIGVNARPGSKIGDVDGSGDGAVLTVDLDVDMHKDSVRTVLVQGIANEIAQHVLPERRGLFG